MNKIARGTNLDTVISTLSEKENAELVKFLFRTTAKRTSRIMLSEEDRRFLLDKRKQAGYTQEQASTLCKDPRSHAWMGLVESGAIRTIDREEFMRIVTMYFKRIDDNMLETKRLQEAEEERERLKKIAEEEAERERKLAEEREKIEMIKAEFTMRIEEIKAQFAEALTAIA